MIETEKKHRAQLDSRAHPTILCVDDEPFVSRALYRLLSREPYDVLVADTARQALRYVRDYGVDLVIADQRMPDMSGVELLTEVRQLSPSTSGLILTAYPESVLVDDAPIPPLVAKPWDDAILKDCVREILRARDAEADGETPKRRRQSRGRSPSTLVAEARGKLGRKPALRTVLVPVDESIEPELTLGSLLPLLNLDPIRIILLQVLSDPRLHGDACPRLERTRERFASEGIDACAEIRWGDLATQILRYARDPGADLVVLSNHEKRGTPRFFRRSVMEKILDESDVPLLIGRPEMTVRSWKRILVPLDGSREAETALPEAVRLAKKFGALITVMGVSPRVLPMEYGYFPYMPRIRDRMPYLKGITRHLELGEVPAEARSCDGNPVLEILRVAEESDTDLICMAARVRAGWARFFDGGVTREIVRGATCPVLIHRPPAREA